MFPQTSFFLIRSVQILCDPLRGRGESPERSQKIGQTEGTQKGNTYFQDQLSMVDSNHDNVFIPFLIGIKREIHIKSFCLVFKLI